MVDGTWKLTQRRGECPWDGGGDARPRLGYGMDLVGIWEHV